MRPSSLRWLTLFLLLLYIEILHASPNQSALLEIAQKLHCAPTESYSQAQLSLLKTLSIEPFGIPSDNFKDNDENYLYAATVDILLQQLLETRQRFPNLQESVERTALLWNFCNIITEGQLVDLTSSSDQKILKKSAAEPFPAKKQGFSLWGFLDPDPNNRYVPKILDVPVFPLAQQSLLFRIFVKQCFPHPDTGKLFAELDETERIGKLRIEKKIFQSEKNYPYSWKFDCQEKAKVIEPAIEEVELTVEKKVEVTPEPIAKKIIKLEIQEIQEIQEKPKIVSKVKPKLDLNLSKRPETVEPMKTKLDTLFKLYAVPAKGEVPNLSVANAAVGSNSGAPLPLPPEGGYGFAGNFYHNSSYFGALSFGANMSWTPHSYFFVRGGVNYKYYLGGDDVGDEPLTYSWGIGYDDWHPGTFSFQLNNWGPIIPGEGFAFDRAVADIGYKFKAEFLKPYKISGSASFSIPVVGEKQLSTTWSWTPFENWFVRVSFQTKPFAYDGVTWSYGFGYSDWRPFTVGLAYNNWGPNSLTETDSLTDDGINFKANGLVSLSWSWAF